MLVIAEYTYLGLTLAQASQPSTSRWLVIIALCIVAVLFLGIGIKIARDQLVAAQKAQPGSEGLMDSLRSMHARGELSQAEFEAAKKAIAERAVAAMDARRAELAQANRPKSVISKPPMSKSAVSPPKPVTRPIARPTSPAPPTPPKPANPPSGPALPPGYDDGSSSQ